MNFVIKNIKKVGIFNSILLALSIILMIVYFFNIEYTLVYFIYDILCFASIISALIYATKGYKKDAAKYYKAFFFLYALYTLFSTVAAVYSTLTRDYEKVFTNEILLGLVAIDAFVLAFGKDLGKKKSIGFACAMLILQLISSFRVFILYPDRITILITYFVRIVIACIACTFVVAKYADKESRGAK